MRMDSKGIRPRRTEQNIGLGPNLGSLDIIYFPYIFWLNVNIVIVPRESCHLVYYALMWHPSTLIFGMALWLPLANESLANVIQTETWKALDFGACSHCAVFGPVLMLKKHELICWKHMVQLRASTNSKTCESSKTSILQPICQLTANA